VRIIRGQACIAHLAGNAEPPEDFHGAGGDVVAFRLGGCGAGASLDDGDVDAAPGEVDRERQPDRSCADDQHIGLTPSRHCHSSSAPEFFTMPAQRSTSLLM
jgi:hypothetical protein